MFSSNAFTGLLVTVVVEQHCVIGATTKNNSLQITTSIFTLDIFVYIKRSFVVLHDIQLSYLEFV